MKQMNSDTRYIFYKWLSEQPCQIRGVVNKIAYVKTITRST
jgi:hypothetical protein